MQPAFLLVLLLGQTPEITLTVPEKPVAYARTVKMKVDVPPATTENNYVEAYIDWDVTERRFVDSKGQLLENPLENDLEVDSAEYKATVSSGLERTSLKISVTVFFIYQDKDGKLTRRTARQTKYVDIGDSKPPVIVHPDDTVVPAPVIPPNVVVPVPYTPVADTFGIHSWSVLTLSQVGLSKSEAKKLAASIDVVIKKAAKGEITDKTDFIKQVAASNVATLGPSLQVWITGYLQPLQLKTNPMNPKIKTIADQIQLFSEIRDGLTEYGG